MKRLDEILKERGIKKIWFVETVMKVRIGSFYSRLHSNSITMEEVKRAADYLKMPIDDLKDSFVPPPKKRPANRRVVK